MWGDVLYGGVSAGQNLYLNAYIDPDRVGYPSLYLQSALRFLNDYPPLRLSMNIQTPGGYETRWSASEVNPLKLHQNLTFSTTMPGGFEHADVSLTRDPRRSFPDLDELSTVTVYGVGGSVAWQGRLETVPSQSGDSLAMTPGMAGWQAGLTDNNAVRELFVENDLTRWQGPLNDRVQFLQNAGVDVDSGEVYPDAYFTGNPYQPALATHFTGAWSRPHTSEAWYDSGGVPIAKLIWAANIQAANVIGGGNGVASMAPDANWDLQAFLLSDSVASSGATYNGTGNFGAAGPTFSGVLTAATATRVYAMVRLSHSLAAGGGLDGVDYALYWTALTLVGNHGLPLSTSLEGVQGILGSDVLRYVIPKYTNLKVTAQSLSTVSTSTFVIPELVFLSSGTVADIVNGVTSFELQDWAVWEGDNAAPTFYWNQRGQRGRKWRARMGPARLQQAGAQIDRLWNGVIVNFTDFTGIARQVGPPGSGCAYTDPGLIDSDPLNPLNELSMRKWAPISTGTMTVATAIQIGMIFLKEQKQLNSSGSAVITGYVEDEHGTNWPAWMIRAGDQISFIDASDYSYRRVVSTSYNDESKANSLTLDTPPDSLQAMLSRLQVSLVPLTGG